MENPGTIIGAQMDNYRVVEKIGEGGMGAVYRAVDVMLERDVALKFLRPELSREPELVQRFRAEAVLLARLNHHFIAPIFGLHRYGEELFIAMEYVPGDTLDARLKRIERFSPDAAMHVTSMVLQALDYAHRLGVIHRDIKPGNVILTPSGTVKVMDFGIARVLGAERRTRAGAIVGTIAYMAPEQIQGLDTDQRADLYSVGTLLYEMLSGHVPFQADTDWALMQAQIANPPQPLRAEVDVPEALEAAVLRALEKSPDRRYQNASEFQLALELVARHPDLHGPEVAPTGIPPSVLTHPSRSTGLPHVASWEETRVGVPTPAVGMRPPLPSAPKGSGAMPAGPMPPDMTRLTPPLGPASGAAFAPATPLAPAPMPIPPVAAPRAAPPAASGGKVAPQAARKNDRAGLLVVGGSIVLIAVLAGGWFFFRNQQQPDETTATPTPVDAAAQAPGPPVDAVTSPAAPGPSPGAPAAEPPPPGSARATAPGGTAGPVRQAPPTPAVPTVPAAGKVASPGAVAPAAPLPSVSSQPAPPAATLESAPSPGETGDVEVFKNLRIVRRGAPEVDIEVQLGPSRVTVTNVGGRVVLNSLPYSSIVSAEYHESRHQRVFVRTTRHWLLLKGPNGGGVLLRLEREDVKGLIAAFERRWGRSVEMLAPEQEKEEK